jgi:hypothetical protein
VPTARGTKQIDENEQIELAEGEVKENAEEKEYDCLKISFRKYS